MGDVVRFTRPKPQPDPRRPAPRPPRMPTGGLRYFLILALVVFVLWAAFTVFGVPGQ